MAKNTPETQTQPENEADKVEQSATTPEQEAQAALQAENAALQPETTADPRQIIEAMSANGDEFWRGGLLFNGAWQTVYRAEVGEEAWQRIVNEPRLRIKAADEYGA